MGVPLLPPWGLVTHFLTFLLGALFLPACLAGVLAYIYVTLPPADKPPSAAGKSSDPVVTTAEHDQRQRAAERRAEEALEDPATYHRVGWLRITREEKESADTPNFANLVKLGLTQMMESKQQQAQRKAKDRYYVVLKYDTLFLYTGEEQIECRGVIIMPMHTVSIHPPLLPDNEVFHKERPILLAKKAPLAASNSKEAALAANGDATAAGDTLRNSYFVYADTPVVKEDWYFALRRAARLRGEISEPEGVVRGSAPPVSTSSAASTLDRTELDPQALHDLQRTVHSNENHIQTQWLNAVMGRVFLSVYRTEMVKQHFINKIRLKITKLKKPSFLGDIAVRDLNVGESVPYITNPRLLGLKDDGELTAEMYLHYSGGFSCEIQTEVQLSVAARLKSLRVPVVLAVVLKGLTGKLLLKIKPAPTNRFWIGFYETPAMDLHIEPVVSDKQVKFGMVIQAIERRIYDMVNENLVLPNMDDTPFFPSQGMGGIFEQFLVPPPNLPATDSPAGSGASPTSQPTAAATESSPAPTDTTTSDQPATVSSQLSAATAPADATTTAAGGGRGRSNSQPLGSGSDDDVASILSAPAVSTKPHRPDETAAPTSRALSLLQSIKGRQMQQAQPKRHPGLVPLPRRASVGHASPHPAPAERSDSLRPFPDHSPSASPTPSSPSLTSASSSDSDSGPDGGPTSTIRQPSVSLAPPSQAHLGDGTGSPKTAARQLPPTSPTHATADSAAAARASASFPPGPNQLPRGRGQPIPYHNQPIGQGIPHSEAHLYRAGRPHDPAGSNGNGNSGAGGSTRFSWLNQIIPDARRGQPTNGDAAPGDRLPYARSFEHSTPNLPWHNGSQSTLASTLSTGAASHTGVSPPSASGLGYHNGGNGYGLGGRLGWLNTGIETLKHTYQQRQQQRAQQRAHGAGSHLGNLAAFGRSTASVDRDDSEGVAETSQPGTTEGDENDAPRGPLRQGTEALPVSSAEPRSQATSVESGLAAPGAASPSLSHQASPVMTFGQSILQPVADPDDPFNSTTTTTTSPPPPPASP
ncbi:hypothetical protein IWQ60_005278 [Tieghemiomyces parasiticus]|uniref:SMP-LTD domain-containing protein n=1 Tax=Tieghemiomyces parasiticus TaxID=78921 RepID=A0A9W8A6D7_9FUNG|nr:hypothetical protein IWQ60_005278 [Tieghemiomyces parasiticus]